MEGSSCLFVVRKCLVIVAIFPFFFNFANAKTWVGKKVTNNCTLSETFVQTFDILGLRLIQILLLGMEMSTIGLRSTNVCKNVNV